jgi:hypothetical protein
MNALRREAVEGKTTRGRSIGRRKERRKEERTEVTEKTK